MVHRVGVNGAGTKAQMAQRLGNGFMKFMESLIFWCLTVCLY